MESEDNCQFHFEHKNYFVYFKSTENDDQNSVIYHINKRILNALECFVDDLKRDPRTTINYFLNEQTVNDIFLFIARLLLSENDRSVYKSVSTCFK